MESFEKEIKVNNILKALQVEFSSNVNSDDNLIKAVILVTEVLNVKLKNNDISKEYFEKSCSVVSDIVKSHPNSEHISQILDEIEKGRKAQVGEVRVWGNKRKQKQSDGSWKTIERLGPSKAKAKGGVAKDKNGQELKVGDKIVFEKISSGRRNYLNGVVTGKDDLGNIKAKFEGHAIESGGISSSQVTKKPVMSQRADEHESGKKKEEPKGGKKFSPKEAFSKLAGDIYSKMRNELGLKAKPGNFKDIPGVDYNKLSQTVKDGLGKLTVVDLPKSYGSSDEGNNSFWADLPKDLQGGTFIGKAGDGNYYMIDTQGYTYSRYVQRLDGFSFDK